jgi:hypothetical protein
MRKPGAALTSTSARASPRADDRRGRDHVDTRDVETDDARRLDGALRDQRMHLVRHVGGAAAGAQVGVATQQHALPAAGTLVLVEPCSARISSAISSSRSLLSAVA